MINDHLKLSDNGIKLLTEIEGLRLKPYYDQTGKTIFKWCQGATIGYGYLIEKHEWDKYKDGINNAQAFDLFKKVLSRFEDVVRQKVIVPINQNQFDALVMFAYNIGVGAFKTTSVLAMINDPCAVTKFPTIEKAWKAWNKSQGIEMEGLNKRRASEWNIFSKGVYARW